MGQAKNGLALSFFCLNHKFNKKIKQMHYFYTYIYTSSIPFLIQPV